MNKMYFARYKMQQHSRPTGTVVLARNKEEAYNKLVFDIIPTIKGESPYSAWVESVTYQNGNHRTFNTFEGKPY